MKRTSEDIHVACDIKGKSKIKDFWNRQVHRVKEGTFSCPLCKEKFTGLGALGTHLKDHCT
jgi:hypothetical protein